MRHETALHNLDQTTMTASQPSVSIKELDLSFGAVEVLKGLNLDIEAGEFLVLLGSSGCGKSTLLSCIAGLLDLTDGQIFINGQNVTWAEPSERGIGMVFQSYALYPQMTVEGNLGFGLRNAGVPKAEVKERIARAAKILQIEPLLKRRPAALSGGQRQRVAIGRALVRDVDVFLFDEPLSNLDAKLRADLRVEIKLLHQKLGNTMIYVTHDQVEAMTLADRIAIMKDGRIMQLGTPDAVYNQPANRYVAEFIGAPAMNFIDGMLSGTKLSFADLTFDVGDYPFQSPPSGELKVTVGLRPEHLIVGPDQSQSAATLELTAEIVEPMGADTLVWSSLGGQRFRVRIDGQTKISAGDTLSVGIGVKTLNLFNAATEQRL